MGPRLVMRRLRRLRIYLGCKRSDDIGISLYVSVMGYPFLVFFYGFYLYDVSCRTQKGALHGF